MLGYALKGYVLALIALYNRYTITGDGPMTDKPITDINGVPHVLDHYVVTDRTRPTWSQRYEDGPTASRAVDRIDNRYGACVAHRKAVWLPVSG